MLLKVTMTRGENKRRITLCKPAVHQSTPILKDFYPDTAWLDSLPFDTAEFDLLISDEPIGDKAAVTLPRIPYATPAGDSYSRFEIRAGQNRHTRTSMEYPATQLLLNNRDLDPKIISEKKSIFLGVSPVLIIDGPEELGIDVGPPTTVVCPPEETDIVVCPPGENVSGESNPKNGSQGEPVAGIKRIEHDLTDKELASKYLGFFLHHHISYSKGSRLTSKQLWAAIDANAPDGVRADLLDLRVVTTAFRQTFGIVMDRTGERIGGENQKFWQDYEVRIYYPDPLERSWYDKKSR